MDETAWEPLPGREGRPSAQSLALACPFDEILFHGTRGSSKTETQLVFFASKVGLGYGAHWRGVIFDRAYKNLDDIIAKSRAIFGKIFPEAKFLSAQSALCWAFPGGERLYFRHLEKPKDYLSFHGQEFAFIGFNELSSYPTSEMYDLMKSCNRSGFLPEKHSPEGKKLPPIPLVTFSTTNPHGPGHSWIKRRWIDQAPPGVPIVTKSVVFNPQTQQDEEIETSLCHIFGSYKENIYLDAKYVAFLNSITDPNRRRAWLAGDWSITSGGAIDDLWSDQRHIVDDFPIPDNWPVDRAFDWGSSAPFSVGWWAEANGETVILPDGREFTPEPGSLIQVAEWYGGESLDSNEGLRMGADEVARGILDRERGFLKSGMMERIPYGGPADSAIYSKDDPSQRTIADVMESEGVSWRPCKKGKGSRKAGLELFRVLLSNVINGEGPGIYFMRRCKASIALLPPLPRSEKDPDDVDTDACDHVYDMARYRLQESSASMIKPLKISAPY